MGDLDLGRERLGDLGVASRLEWLVTNGIGGFAAGTASGDLTRVCAFRGYSSKTQD